MKKIRISKDLREWAKDIGVTISRENDGSPAIVLNNPSRVDLENALQYAEKYCENKIVIQMINYES